MSLKIGITGGIGVGKSVVTKIFKVLGNPTYDADKEAKDIMVKNDVVRQSLVDTLGQEVYFQDGSLNREWLGKRQFADAEDLKKLNDIVQPAVIQDDDDWAAAYPSQY